VGTEKHEFARLERVNDVRGTIGVLTLDNPPVNCVAHPLRKALFAALEMAEHDPGVKAVVMIGAGKVFSAGADLNEMDTPAAMAEPNLHTTLIEAMEAMTKPVIAAIHGAAIGGGLELALGAHYRVADPDAKLGLPEVTLGLMPGAGGTQRLPRALGLERGLSAILTGRLFPAREAPLQPDGTGLIDATIDGDLRGGAVEFANRVADARPLPRLRDVTITHPNAEAFLQFARGAARSDKRRLPGLLPAVNAVAAAVFKPFDDGLAFELAEFSRLRETPETRAFRDAFLAERKRTPSDTGAAPGAIK